MRVTAEPGVEPGQLLMHHGVLDDAVVKRCVLLGRREFAVEQEITCFKKGAVLGELFDRVTAIPYYSLVEVDERDLRLAACRRGEAGVVGEAACVLIEGTDVDHVRA